MQPIVTVLKSGLFYRGIGLIAAGAALLFATDHVVQFTHFNALTTHAGDLVDDALARDGKTFLTLSGIKAVVSMLEGSNVGVGFEFQVGDLVQPAYDYVDFVWRIFLYAFAILGFYKILLDSDILHIGFYLTGVGCLVWALSPVVRSFRPTLSSIGKRFILLGVLLALIVPMSLIGTHHISSVYLSKIKEENAKDLEVVQAQFNRIQDEFLELKNRVSLLNPSESVDEIIARGKRIMDSTRETMIAGTFAGLYYTLILLCELLVLPFVAAYVLYKVVALILGFGVFRAAPPAPATADAPSAEKPESL